MKDQMKKYLLCGGVLLGLGVVSAGLLSGVNLITAPIIEAEAEKKVTAGYREVFSEAKAFEKKDFSTDEEKKTLADNSLTPSAVDYYVIAYSDEAKTKELGMIFHGTATGFSADVEVLVGFVMENGSPALKKISLLECSDSFKNTFVKNYLDPVNAGTKSYDDYKNIGATHTSTAVYTVVNEANKLFAALAGGIVEDPSAWNQAAFAGKNYKVSSSSTKVESSAYAEFSKYYSYYDDELSHNEIGRWYVGNDGDFTAAIAVSEKGFEGGYVLSSKYTDVDYKTSPFYSASSLPSGDTGTALSSLGEKAAKLSASSPLQTIEYQAISLYEGGDHATKTAINQNIAGVDNLGADTESWPSSNKRQVIANSYTVYDKDNAELGVVYEAEFHLSLGTEDSLTQAHGGLYFLLGFSGSGENDLKLTNIAELENSFTEARSLREKVIDKFNASTDKSWSSFKSICEADAKVGDAQIGATVSSHGLYAVANLERVNYLSLKGGK